ncbi:hypothetical protein ACO2Q8_23020 [Larkinella sp. VNQ87]|uniref:hypothetical protein n=1 Tax=Larkinella sp. VNQ87 TaxID=3400921 RepID=UPI003C04C79F
MPSNALTEKTIKSTLNTLGNHEPNAISPKTGLSTIDDWLNILEGSKPAEHVLQELRQLRSVLQMPNPDTDLVKGLLNNLADNTTQLAQSNEGPWINELEQIVVALRTFGSQLSPSQTT